MNNRYSEYFITFNFRNEEQVHSKVPFEACLSKLAAPEEITAYSSAVKTDVVMEKITRLRTFPDYLFIQVGMILFRGYMEASKPK